MKYTELLKIKYPIKAGIYGAGTIGRLIYNKLIENSNVNIITWIDQKYKRINDTPIEIINPQDIRNYPCQVVVIAIYYENGYKSQIKTIINDLKNNGYTNQIVYLLKNELLEIMKNEINYALLYDDFARKCFINRFLNNNMNYDKLKNQIYKFFLHNARIRYWNNSIEPRCWCIGKNPNIAYLSLAKNACTSIISTLIEEDIKGDIHPLVAKKYEITGNMPNEKNVYKFTFVRNPFERLVSNYVDKIKNWEEKNNYYKQKNYYMGLLDNILDFKDFVKKICNIPDEWADRHFKLQYSYIYDENGNMLVDYIGKVENLPNDYLNIQKKYGLKNLEYRHRSGKADWKTFYTEETAKLVYEYYKKDIITFGYEEVYKELLIYINTLHL